jgi:drug/metabolite transporter (DMT)-like permease
MSSPAHSKETMPDTGSFEKLAGLASSFSVGLSTAFAASLKQINPTLEFNFGLLTLVCFVVGFAATLWIHGVIFNENLDEQDPNRRKKALIFFGTTMMVAVICCMGFALKGISPEKLKEVGIGVAIAVFFMSIAFFFFFKVVGFLQRDEENNSLDE